MPKHYVRACSYRNVADSGLNPQAYKLPNEPMVAEVILDFWGKSPCLGCYFRDTSDGGKVLLFAYNDARDDCSPCDGVIDFSEAGIENGL